MRIERRRRREQVRRRRARLAAGAVAAFAAGAAIGAAGGDERTPARDGAKPAGDAPPAEERAAVDTLTLEQQVGRMVILRFAGTQAPGYVRRVLRQGRAAGVILFRDNVVSPGQLRALTRSLRRASPESEPLVCLDQEGGEIRILEWAGPERAAGDQAAAGTVRADSLAAGRDLRAGGVNVTLAPVADVPSVSGAALASRAFSSDPDRAATAVADAIAGWHDAGVATTVKHFPGLGGATVNTDDGPATITRTPHGAGRRPRAVPRRDRRRHRVRDGRPRDLPGARRPAHRVAVAGRDRRPAAQGAGLRRRGHDRLAGGRRRAGRRRRRAAARWRRRGRAST